MPVIPQPYPGSGQNPFVAPPPGSGVIPTPTAMGGSPLDLTTPQYTIQVLTAGGLTLNTAENAILPSLITAASHEIIRYTGNLHPAVHRQ